MVTKISRQAMIIDFVSKGGSLEVVDLAAHLNVSGETIRRDIKELQSKGLVTKVHGGVTVRRNLSNTAFHDRLKLNSDAKIRIGEKISSIVGDGDSLIIEAGSTSTYVAQALTARKNLTVVTNSVDVARSVAFREDNSVYMAGGKLTADDGAALDLSAAEYVRRFRMKYAIFSVAGIDVDDGLTSNSVAEAEFSRLSVSRVEIPILAVDSSKFGMRGLAQTVSPSAIRIVVTDASLTKEYRSLFENAEIMKV